MALKQYVLLDNMDSDAPIFQQTVGGKRIQLKKIPLHRPALQITFTDKEGQNKTIRYKGNANTIFQDDQIKAGILANERFTTTERRDPEFKFGLLSTTKPLLQTFLEAHPECEGFEGQCDDIREPKYRLLDTVKDVKVNNSDLRKRAKAANKIFDLTLRQAQDMLIRLNGSYFKTPEDVEECQNLLIDFLDNTEDGGINAILKNDEDLNIDEQTTILIGGLINAGLLSFDKVEGKISKKLKDGKWADVRDMASDYSMEEKKRLFSDFLNTDAGKALKTDLENDLAAFESKSSSKQLKIK